MAARLPAPKFEALPTGLFIAVLAYLIVTFARVQDLVPGLEYIKPGMLATGAVLLLWLASKSFGHLQDAIVKWQLFLAVVMVVALPMAANHFYFFWNNVNYWMFIIALTFGLPAVARFPRGRLAILKVLLLSFLFLACWALTHDGVGTAAYFQDENDAAAGMIVGGCLGYALWQCLPKSLWSRLALLTIALSAAGVVATASRGGFVGMVAAIGAILFFSGRLLKASIAALVIVVLALPFVPAEYKADVRSISDPTDETRTERIYSWNRGVDLWRLSPLVGVGTGNYPWRLAEVEMSAQAIEERAGRRMISGRAAHSLYFTLLPENGVLGVVAFFAMMWLIVSRGARIVRAPPDPAHDPALRAIALFLATGLIAFSVSAIFISVLWYPQFWLMAGLAILLSPHARLDDRGIINWKPPAKSGVGSRRVPSRHRAAVDQDVDAGRVHGNRIPHVDRKTVEANRRRLRRH